MQYETYVKPDRTNEPQQYIPVMSIILVIINVLVFFYAEVTGGSEDTQHMVEMGAMFRPALFSGDYYRLITHFFLHFGFEHLMNNMLSLLVLGYALEGRIGRFRFLLLYFFSGVLAGVSSIIYNIYMGEDVVSAGASGAIYGLMGSLLAYMVFERQRMNTSDIPKFLLYIAISIYGGIQDISIDNAAHVGGLISGFILCALLSIITNQKERHRYHAS